MYELEFVLVIPLVFIVTSHMGDYKKHVGEQHSLTTVFPPDTDIVLHKQTDAEGGHCGIPDEKTHKRLHLTQPVLILCLC